mmetsp:Transcript_43127/g.70611  ORF Transcript_43127/g.70611 Transcript_43127/m.70611 type:complete len:100 (-) Transcript_43127:15-314(-)
MLRQTNFKKKKKSTTPTNGVYTAILARPSRQDCTFIVLSLLQNDLQFHHASSPFNIFSFSSFLLLSLLVMMSYISIWNNNNENILLYNGNGDGILLHII